MPRRVRYPHVQRTRDGRSYLRKPGLARVRLPGTFGSHEFEVAYFAAIAAKPIEIGAARTLPRSMNALIVLYYDSEFKKLQPSTARSIVASLSGSARNTATKTPWGSRRAKSARL